MFRVRTYIRWFVYALLLSVLLALLLLVATAVLPKSQSTPSFIIGSGDSVRAVAAQAKENGHVYSEFGFLFWYRALYANEAIIAGQYLLPKSATLVEFIEIVTSGDTTEDYTAITFPEGTTIDSMARAIEATDTQINTVEYTELLADKEGYAFPETYYVTDTTTAAELVAIQLAAYEEEIASLQERIAEHPLTEYEIITLASIIEREANDGESMRMVSGILQNRLEIDMPLQADASLEYVLDKPLSELTPSDLQMESPYNTYQNRGLPPTPIGNPGLTAITAVLEPTANEYFYYITGRDGNFYYARTLDEHNDNIARYLR